MECYRTLDGAFADLPGYPFGPNYHDFEGMRMHHLDEGSGDPMALRSWEIPALIFWSDSDPIFQLKAGHAMARLLRGSGGARVEVTGASHMLQEDKGEEIAQRLLDWVGP